MDANQNSVAAGLMTEFCPSLGRLIVFLDFDAFRVQVEGEENEEVRQWIEDNVPIVVATDFGSVLSVSYGARAMGIERVNGKWPSLSELKQKFGEHTFKVHRPAKRFNRTDMFTPERYMNWVYKALLAWRWTLGDPSSVFIQWQSLEEIYIDVTYLVRRRCGKGRNVPFDSRMNILCNSTKTDAADLGAPVTVMESAIEAFSGQKLRSKVVEWSKQRNVEEMNLVHAGCIANAIVRFIKTGTGFQASAGVGNTKLLARLACLQNKPQGVTVLSFAAMPRVSSSFRIGQVHGYGAKLASKLAQAYSEMAPEQSLESFADVQKLGPAAVSTLTDLFMQLGWDEEKAEDKAQDLVYRCHGNDGERVTISPFCKRTMSGTAIMRQNASIKIIKDRIRNLVADMADRINFYMKQRRRYPQHVKVNIAVTTRRKARPLVMQRGFNNADHVFGFILDEIQRMGIYLNHVKSVAVTAVY